MLNAEKLVGTVLSDRYEILDKIGTGGMAMVYKAHDRVLDRDVAIKILRDGFEGNSAIVSNFIREARSSASLVHANVVSVYDVVEYEGLNYMVMELVDGITLKKYIMKHPRLPWQEACDYAIQIGQGIQAAHERGIIHRDIKPQNIIMAPGGILKVTDFGIAKAMESDTAMAGGTATGSVHYVSPEQARGGFTDFRSDIYSLGICLYEMLAGRVPFDGDSPVSVALMHIEEEPVNVKCVNMDIPSDLAYVTMKAMNREPGKRYQRMQDFLDDLRAVLADESLPSREAELRKKNEQKREQTERNTPEKKAVTHMTNDDMTNRGRQTRVKKKKRTKAKKKKEDRNSVILALSTVAVLLLIAGGLFMLMFNPFADKSVPNLANMSIEEAINAARDSGYSISNEIEYSLSDTVEADRIISQDPEAGAKADQSQPIRITVSLGGSGGGIAVPAVTNVDADTAGAMLEKLGLQYRLVSEYNDTAGYGMILRQSPAEGTHINYGDYVTLHMSIGPKTVAEDDSLADVPSLIGMYPVNAEAQLNDLGLTIGTISKKASSSPEGTVILQSPTAGSKIRKGSTVTIVISSGDPSSTLTSDYEGYVPPELTEEAYQEPEPAENGESNGSEEDYSDTGAEAQQPGGSGTQLFTVKIPDGANDTVTVEIVVNGETVHNAEHRKSEGSVSVEISGEGKTSVQAYIDGAKVSDKTVTF